MDTDLLCHLPLAALGEAGHQRGAEPLRLGAFARSPRVPPGERAVWLLGSKLFGFHDRFLFIQGELSFPAAQGEWLLWVNFSQVGILELS